MAQINALKEPLAFGRFRLLRSIKATDFENETDKFDVEIHVDKSVGLHYQECVE